MNIAGSREPMRKQKYTNVQVFNRGNLAQTFIVHHSIQRPGFGSYNGCTLLEVQEMVHNFTNKLNYNPIAAKHGTFSF